MAHRLGIRIAAFALALAFATSALVVAGLHENAAPEGPAPATLSAHR